MALAYLAKRVESSGLIEGLTVTAFVVDHKAREESSSEAKMVARWLSDMSMFRFSHLIPSRRYAALSGVRH